MEDINKIMKNINVPYLNNYMSTESIILGFIQFVKDIERRRGLTEKQITAKYAHGCCEQLQQSILKVVKAAGKSNCINRRISNCKMPNLPNLKGGSHYVVQTYPEDMSTEDIISGKGDKETLFFDITGMHGIDWPEKFANEFYIKNENLIHTKRAMTEEQLGEDDDIPIPYYAATSMIEINKDMDRHEKVQNLINRMGWYSKGQSTVSISDLKKRCSEYGINFEDAMELAQERADFREDIDKLSREELMKLWDKRTELDKTDIRKEIEPKSMEFRFNFRR